MDLLGGTKSEGRSSLGSREEGRNDHGGGFVWSAKIEPDVVENGVEGTSVMTVVIANPGDVVNLERETGSGECVLDEKILVVLFQVGETSEGAYFLNCDACDSMKVTALNDWGLSSMLFGRALL